MLSVLACTTDLAWIVSALSQTVNSSQFCQPCFLQNFLILLVLFCVTYPILCQQFLLLPALVFCNSSWFSQPCLVQQILDFVSPVSVNSPSFSSVLQHSSYFCQQGLFQLFLHFWLFALLQQILIFVSFVSYTELVPYV